MKIDMFDFVTYPPFSFDVLNFLLLQAKGTLEKKRTIKTDLGTDIERVNAELTVIIFFVCNHTVISQNHFY